MRRISRAHFTVSEFIHTDVREAARAPGLPAVHPVRNGSARVRARAVPRSGRHLRLHRRQRRVLLASARGTGAASPHCWGTAANIYRIGDTYLDTPETIRRFAALAREVIPTVWTRPLGDRRAADRRSSAHRSRLRRLGAARGAGRDATTSSSPAIRCDAARGRRLGRFGRPGGVGMSIERSTEEAETRATSGSATRRHAATRARAALPAIGLEAEFATIVDDVLARPEDVFGSPRTHRARSARASHRPLVPPADGRRRLLRHRA